MDSGAPPDETTDAGTHPALLGSSPDPRPESATPPQAIQAVGLAFAQTVRHFWPGFNGCLDQLPDTRFQPAVEYDKRFLTWWGLFLFLGKLGSRRQLDFDLDAQGTCVLTNINRLAGTHQRTRPVHDTLDHFLEHLSSQPLAHLRTCMNRRLIRMKALDGCRLLGHFVLALDGTGHLSFHRRHCEHCLTQNHGGTLYYFHNVLEAKLVGDPGLALSFASEFMLNPSPPSAPLQIPKCPSKQDSELEALSRLAPQLKAAYPQTPFCLSGDSLYACGRLFSIAEIYPWRYVCTFKSGHLPALWDEFQRLLPSAPENTRTVQLADGTRLTFRWINHLAYTDSDNRPHTLSAIQCEETSDSHTRIFAWVTNFHVTSHNVRDIATKGGRYRWNIENQGFNAQKNSELNLEHAYSFNNEKLKAYYFLLQIAHTILQLLQYGSLLRHLAAQTRKTTLQLFGSLKNIARRLLEACRYHDWPDLAFSADAASRIQIRLDSS